jgi:hypothetical protein
VRHGRDNDGHERSEPDRQSFFLIPSYGEQLGLPRPPQEREADRPEPDAAQGVPRRLGRPDASGLEAPSSGGSTTTQTVTNSFGYVEKPTQSGKYCGMVVQLELFGARWPHLRLRLFSEPLISVVRKNLLFFLPPTVAAVI